MKGKAHPARVRVWQAELDSPHTVLVPSARQSAQRQSAMRRNMLAMQQQNLAYLQLLAQRNAAARQAQLAERERKAALRRARADKNREELAERRERNRETGAAAIKTNNSGT